MKSFSQFTLLEDMANPRDVSRQDTKDIAPLYKWLTQQSGKSIAKKDPHMAKARDVIGQEIAKRAEKGEKDAKAVYRSLALDKIWHKERPGFKAEEINEAIMVTFQQKTSHDQRWGRVHAKELVDKLKKAKVKHKTDKAYHVSFDITSYNDSPLAKKMSVGELIADIQKNNGEVDFSERDAMGRKKRFESYDIGEATSVNKAKVPVYVEDPRPGKTAWQIIGYVSKQATSIGATKVSKDVYPGRKARAEKTIFDKDRFPAGPGWQITHS
jgi:hypothetical protein